MTTDYKRPTDVSKRVRFYDGQFMQDQDFIDEQSYHLDRQARLGRSLQIAGIVEGLVLSAADQPFFVNVSPGTAVDLQGHAIVLADTRIELDQDGLAIDRPSSEPFSLGADTANSEQFLYLAYCQLAVDLQQGLKGLQGETRWLEAPFLFLSKGLLGADDAYERPPWTDYLTMRPTPVLLGRLAIGGDGTVTILADRGYSGLRLPGPAEGASWVMDENGRIQLRYGQEQPSLTPLTVSRRHIGIGEESPTAALEITAVLWNQHLKLSNERGDTVGPSLYLNAKEHDWAIIGTNAGAGAGANKLGFLDVSANTYRMVLDTNGNFGIGTSTPTTRLDVVGVGGSTVDLQVNGRLRSNNNDGGLWVAEDRFIGGHSTNKLGLWNNKAWRLTVEPNGNVGIGTLSPGNHRLNVTGGSTMLGDTLTVSGATTLQSSLTVSGASTFNGNITVGADDTLNFGTNVKQMINLYRTNFGIGIQGNTQYYRSDKNFAWYRGGSHDDRELIAGSGGTAMLVIKDGNVGINTNAPTTRLEVVGAGGGSVDLLVNGRIKSNNNDGGLWVASDRFIGGHSTNKVGFYNNSEWRLTVEANGNVGIGTKEPKAQLEVLANTKTVSGWYEAIRFSQAAHSAITHPAGGLLFGLHGNRNFYFADIKDNTFQKYVMTINAESGNVSIGAGSSANRLHVAGGSTHLGGALSVTGAATLSSNLTVGGTTTLNGNVAIGVDDTLSFGSNVRQMVNLHGPQYGVGVQSATQYFRTGRNFAWYKAGAHDNGELNAGSGGVVQMVIRDGNVGIGTNNPGSNRLNVAGGNTTLGGALSVSGATTLRNNLTVQGASTFNGNISVGADDSISFGNGVRQMLNLYSTQYGIGVQSSTQYFRTYKNFAWYKGGSHNNGELNAGTGGVAQMVIRDGNVGIATNAPSQRLEVSGNVKINGARLYNANGYSLMETNGDSTWLRINTDGHFSAIAQYRSVAIEHGLSVGSWEVLPAGQIKANSSFSCLGHAYFSAEIYKKTGGAWYRLGHGAIHTLDGRHAYWDSDQRLKKDIVPLQNAIEKIRQLQGVFFHWNDKALARNSEWVDEGVSAGQNSSDEENEQVRQAEKEKIAADLSGQHLGLLAQQVEKVLPALVKTDEKGVKQVNYGLLPVFLIEAFKELDEKVSALSKQVATLARQ